MGYFDSAPSEDIKKLQKNKQTVGKFFAGVGSGFQQGAAMVGDTIIQAGAVAGSIGKSDKELVEHMAAAQRVRDKLHNLKDFSGETIKGTSGADQAAANIIAGKGSAQDFATVAGTGLQVGVNATMFANPTSLLTKGAAGVGAKQFAIQAAKEAALFGGTQGAATTATKYGETGDIGQSLVAGATDAATAAAFQVGSLGLGYGVGKGISKLRGTDAPRMTSQLAGALDNETVARNTAQAAETAYPSSGTVINGVDDVVPTRPMTTSELGRAATMENPNMAAAAPEQVVTQPTAQAMPNGVSDGINPATLDPTELSTVPSNSFLNDPNSKFAKPDRFTGKQYAYDEVATGLTNTGKDVDGRIVFGKDGDGKIIIKDGRHLLEGYRDKGIQIPERKVKLEDGVTMKDVAPSYKSMAAEITPGAKPELVANITMTDEQLNQAVSQLGDLKPKQQAKALKDMGATDEQLRKAIGIDSQGNKLKPLKIKNTLPEPELKPEPGSLGEGIINDITDKAGNASPEVNKLAEVLGALPEDIVKGMSGSYRSLPSTTRKVMKSLTENIDNVSNNMSRMAGKVGSDVADRLQTGATFKAKFIDETKSIIDSVKEFTADKLGVTEAKAQVARIRSAVENGDTALLKAGDQPAYDAAKQLFDRTKEEMIARGRNVKDNYFTHATLESDDDATGRVLDAIFGGNSDPESIFSKRRVGDTPGEVADMHTLLSKYQQGMANDLAYTDAFKTLQSELKNIPTHLSNDAANMSAFREYTSNLFKHARSGSSETALSRIVGKPLDAFTDNVLRFNIGNTFKNFTDRIKTNSILSKEAKAIKVDPEIMLAASEHRNFNFGNSKATGTGQNPTRLSKIGEAIDKISPNTKTEMMGVNYNFEKGMAQGFAESPIYLKAKANGATEAAAQAAAIAQDGEQIYRRANAVAGTASAGNAMQQMASLRNGKPLFGMIPWKSVTRFVSYPLTNTATFIRNMDPKSARIIEAYVNGTAAGASKADAIGGGNAILDMMKNMAKDPGNTIPKDVMAVKIKGVEDAIKSLEENLASGSRVSRGNTAATFAKVWGATTAIQMAITGVQDTVFNRKGSDKKQKDVVATAIGQSPFLDVNRTVNPVMNPFVTTSYGTPQINAGGLLNAIPYVGGVDSLTGGNLAKWVNKNIGKPVNSAITKTFR